MVMAWQSYVHIKVWVKLRCPPRYSQTVHMWPISWLAQWRELTSATRPRRDTQQCSRFRRKQIWVEWAWEKRGKGGGGVECVKLPQKERRAPADRHR